MEVFIFEIAEMKMIGDIEGAIWDWMLLLRGISLKALVHKGDIARMRETLKSAEVGSADEPERTSMILLCDAFEGSADASAERLKALAEANADHMMTWQRLSHACWLSRDFAGAAAASARATELGDRIPVMLAWDGMTALRARAFERAVNQLQKADEANLGLASIPSLLAQALEAADRSEEALKAIERAAGLSSTDPEFAMQRARLLDQLGRPDEAIEVLQVLVDCLRATGRVFVQLVELLNRTGNHVRAADTVRIGQERYPTHPAMQRLADENAA